jgi:hypothetical protein
MDPLTVIAAALATATAALTLATKVWDATPTALQQQDAADWAKSVHNVASFINSIGDKINALVSPHPPAK